MTADVVIESFNNDDLEPLRQLFASYFPPGDRLLTPEYSRWLYGDNPFGRALMVKVLEGARWVGFMAMIPVTLNKGGEDLSAYYVVNVLVHPDFHGKHLFGRMIKAAMVRVAQEKAALLGHPNDMALKSWQRARMQFHEPLRPSIAWPRLWPKAVRAREVTTPSDLSSSAAALVDITTQSDQWRVAATPDYLVWRYLRHPSNSYVVQVLSAKGQAVGVQVTKAVKPGLRLLVDQFVHAKDAKDATALLPPLTICFWPESLTAAMSGAVGPLPWKKRVPFFLTRPQQQESSSNLARIGLSASDF